MVDVDIGPFKGLEEGGEITITRSYPERSYFGNGTGTDRGESVLVGRPLINPKTE
jgi:hypothetical protein